MTRLGANLLDSLESFLTVSHVAENDVLAIKVREGIKAEEELGAVGVGTSVGHGQAADARVLATLAGEGLVGELVAVDGLAAGAVVVGEVATLAHEALDDAVEAGTLVAEALLTWSEKEEAEHEKQRRRKVAQ